MLDVSVQMRLHGCSLCCCLQSVQATRPPSLLSLSTTAAPPSLYEDDEEIWRRHHFPCPMLCDMPVVWLYLTWDDCCIQRLGWYVVVFATITGMKFAGRPCRVCGGAMVGSLLPKSVPMSGKLGLNWSGRLTGPLGCSTTTHTYTPTYDSHPVGGAHPLPPLID